MAVAVYLLAWVRLLRRVALLAAAGVLSVRPALPRRVLVAPLLAVPLATSVRYDLLIARPDTRVAVASAVAAVAAPETPVIIDFELALEPGALPDDVEMLPPGGDYRVMRTGRNWATRLLSESEAQVFIRPSGAWSGKTADDAGLHALGFRHDGSIEGGRGSDVLPDAPQHPTLGIWTARRPGPSIDVWVRSEAAEARLERILPVAELAMLGLRPRGPGTESGTPLRPRRDRGVPSDVWRRCTPDPSVGSPTRLPDTDRATGASARLGSSPEDP